MRRIILSVILVLTVFLQTGFGQRNVTVTNVRTTEARPGSQGLYYFLPRTVVTVDVSVARIQQVPGPFAEFAGRFLGLQNVIRQPSTTFEIATINISSFAEPDPNQIYYVEIPAGRGAPEEFFISLSESGLIQSINMPFNNQEFMKGISETREFGHFGSAETFNYFIDSNLHERIDTILERIRVDTLTVERRTLRRSMVEKTPEVRAKEVADFILKIRDKRFDMINGFAEIPYSKEAIEYMYTEMGKMEEDYLQLFRGLRSTSMINYRFTFIPDPNLSATAHTLFHFSEREGVLPANRRDGTPVTILAEKNETTNQLGAFINRNTIPKNTPTGFFYRIPEHANVSVSSGTTQRATARLLINQFGIVTNLPSNNMAVEFYPNTGSIKSIGKPDED